MIGKQKQFFSTIFRSDNETKPVFMVFIIGLTFASAEAFKGYRELAKECKEDIIKTGNYATVNDVKKALSRHDWIVADVRTKEEWNWASLESLVMKKMGFKKVLVYDIYDWIDKCQSFETDYSRKKNKNGTGKLFGTFKAEHCYK